MNVLPKLSSVTLHHPDPSRSKAPRRHGVPSSCDGLMLVECLVYIGVWFVIAGLGFSLFYGTLLRWKLTARSADDMVRALKAGEQWRHEVRTTTAPPELINVNGATEELTLRHLDRSRVYRFTGTNVVCRTHPNGEWTELLHGVKSSRFLRDQRDGVTSWRWELELRSRASPPTIAPLFTFQAVASTTRTP